MKKLSLLSAIFLFTIGALAQVSNEELKQLSKLEVIAVGQPLPEIRLPNQHGDTINVSGLKGKLVYLNFWATILKNSVLLKL